MTGPAEPTDDRYGDVLFYFGWWDCPRSGVAVVDGEPMHFDCPFDELLDDYPSEFVLWPATGLEVSAGMTLFGEWAKWRGRFDAGRATAAFEGNAVAPPLPPPSARRAVPEWHLDADRTFVNRVPKHRVRWRFLD